MWVGGRGCVGGSLGERFLDRLGRGGMMLSYRMVRDYLREEYGVPRSVAWRLSGLLHLGGGVNYSLGGRVVEWVERLRGVEGDELVSSVVGAYDGFGLCVGEEEEEMDDESRRWEELLRRVPVGKRASGREIVSFLYNYAGSDPGEIDESEVPCRGALVHLRVISADKGAYLEFLRSPMMRMMLEDRGGRGGRDGVAGVDEWMDSVVRYEGGE